MNEREKILQELSAYLDGELSADEARQVESLLSQPQVARELEELRKTRQLLRGLPAAQPAEDFVERVLAQAERRNLIGNKHDVAVHSTNWLRYVATAAVVLIVCGAGIFIFAGLKSSTFDDQISHEPTTELAKLDSQKPDHGALKGMPAGKSRSEEGRTGLGPTIRGPFGAFGSEDIESSSSAPSGTAGGSGSQQTAGDELALGDAGKSIPGAESRKALPAEPKPALTDPAASQPAATAFSSNENENPVTPPPGVAATVVAASSPSDDDQTSADSNEIAAAPAEPLQAFASHVAPSEPTTAPSNDVLLPRSSSDSIIAAAPAPSLLRAANRRSGAASNSPMEIVGQNVQARQIAKQLGVRLADTAALVVNCDNLQNAQKKVESALASNGIEPYSQVVSRQMTDTAPAGVSNFMQLESARPGQLQYVAFASPRQLEKIEQTLKDDESQPPAAADTAVASAKALQKPDQAAQTPQLQNFSTTTQAAANEDLPGMTNAAQGTRIYSKLVVAPQDVRSRDSQRPQQTVVFFAQPMVKEGSLQPLLITLNHHPAPAAAAVPTQPATAPAQ